ncbi:Peptide ABC transporter permease [Paraburkholderia unamae]|uniref:ABC transporter permease n=1 Tax=Paraburkholderia unamae TaxID=219649 RepID=UPI001CB434F6|nr:ABC transporter permease [Paraburkholderia unamae]CAG9265618.1 Peptide ABC transporter permease [Paraburkholderia unamae]
MSRGLPALSTPVAGAQPARRAAGITGALLRERSVVVGLLIVVCVAAAALAAPLVAAWLGHGPTQQFRDTALSEMGLPVGPSRAFPFGADDNGRDVFVRTLYGARLSLLIALPATTLAMVVGTVIGLVAGYLGGNADRILSQAIDVTLSFPFVVTSLSLIAFARGADGTSVVNPATLVIVVIALFSWTYFARLVRGLTLALRSQPFVEAAAMTGAGRLRILWREILPNIAPAVIVYWAVQLPNNIIAEATLSFLGVGVQAPTASLGNMIADAQRSSMYQVQPWFLLGPGIMLFLIVVGFNSLSSGLRDVLDPSRR